MKLFILKLGRLKESLAKLNWNHNHRKDAVADADSDVDGDDDNLAIKATNDSVYKNIKKFHCHW